AEWLKPLISHAVSSPTRWAVPWSMGSEVFRERLADALAAGDFELHCRIYHHRSFGRLHFFDTLAVDPISRESFIVELLCRAAESETVTEVVGSLA
ncbi:unnamed protein product, partial [Effrenium voratum]